MEWCWALWRTIAGAPHPQSDFNRKTITMKASESVRLPLEWKPNVNYSSRSIFDLFNFPLNSQLNLMMLLINVRQPLKF